jgi:UDP-GlcNAc3NAcA epimerase
MTIVGARPQFIKAAMLSRELMKRDSCSETMVHTGQHYDAMMSNVFFKEMGLPQPQFNLKVGSGSHGAQTARMLEKLEEVMIKVSPDWVVVYGDTNSTLAGALAAAKLNIPVVHVEAGLRSFNRRMPEEINRILVDQLSTILFTPTDHATDYLRKENFALSKIYQVEDIMLDAVRFYISQNEKLKKTFPNKPYCLVTIHRAENTDIAGRLRAIIEGLEDLNNTIEVIWPIHPRAAKSLDNFSITTKIKTRTPVGYLEMLELIRGAEVVVTDSGGIQKEAFILKVPCVTVRTETEWVELLHSGWNCLVNPSNSQSIPLVVHEMMTAVKSLDYPDLYGEGDAAGKMVDVLLSQ